MLSLGLRDDVSTRQGGSNEDIAVQLPLSGGGPLGFTEGIGAELVAAMSEAAAAWGRRLALATVDPVRRGVDAAALYRIAWGMAFYGEHCELIVMRAGRVSLLPAFYFEVDGFGLDPDQWVYRLDISTPDQQIDSDAQSLASALYRCGASSLLRSLKSNSQT